MLRNGIVVLALLGFVAGTGGCGRSSTEQIFSEQEAKERRKQEFSPDLKNLIEMEKKFGMDHSQVRQNKMELGLDPDKPAAEQQLP
jgi:hypothetical protein